MRRFVLSPVLALAVLSGCGAGPNQGPTENTVAEMPDGASADGGSADGASADSGAAGNAGAPAIGGGSLPGNESAGNNIYCAAVDYVTSEAQCQRFEQEKANLEQGLGVLNAPRQMVVGESRDLVLAVGKKADAQEVRDSVGGNASEQIEVKTVLGHFMTATLTGGGFEISPAGPQQKTLAANRSEAWQWRIKAREAGPQKLLLTVSVDATAPDGTRSSFDLARKPIDIDVVVTDAQRREDRTKALEDKIGHGTRLMSAAEKWLIGLAALIAAIGGVWIAVRTFGKRKDGGGDPPKPDGKPK